MIAPDAEAPGVDFRGQVPIADLPCKREQMLGIPAPHFHQRFRPGAHLDDPAIAQNKAIAMTQQPPVKTENTFAPWAAHLGGSQVSSSPSARTS
jgi:hypothetical protein